MSFAGLDLRSWHPWFLSGVSPLHLQADKRALLLTSKDGARCLFTSRRPVTGARVPMTWAALLGGSGLDRARELQTWCRERPKQALPQAEAAIVIVVAAALAGMMPVALARRNVVDLNGTAW